jgi:hypothetical protein
VTTPPQTRVPEDGRTAVEAINVESAGRLISSGQQLVLCGRGRRGWSLREGGSDREGGGLQLQPRAPAGFVVLLRAFFLAPFGWPRWRRGCVVLLLPSSPPGAGTDGDPEGHTLAARAVSRRGVVSPAHWRWWQHVSHRRDHPSVRPSVRPSIIDGRASDPSSRRPAMRRTAAAPARRPITRCLQPRTPVN